MENDDIVQNLKTFKIKLKLNPIQKQIINEWFSTANYVYNKTIKLISTKHKINFQSLRDKVVTNNSKKNDVNYKNITLNKKNIKKIISKLNLLNEKLINLNIINNNSNISKLIIKNNKDINKFNKLLSNYKLQLKSIKHIKNNTIKEWELNTPKDIRAGAVSDICDAYKTGFSNLKAGNIKFFKIGYRKRKNNTSISIPSSLIKYKNNKLILAPDYLNLNSELQIGKRIKKELLNFKIEHDSRIIKKNNEYWLHIPIPFLDLQNNISPIVNYCGIDPGCRTFLTTFGNKNNIEYIHNKELLKKLNNKIKILKAGRINQRGFKKKAFNKIEKRKNNLINELHWKTINDILIENDIIFYGDIKSHDIVKHKKNKTLNRDINDLKFYLFKQRLIFKANERNKKVYIVNESYTSKTCSTCGEIYDIGISKIYDCKNNNCLSKNHIIDRDMNAAKNILMKGIILNQ